ncbi:CNBD2 [Branchiostoma lanceolatum]|uniref:Cyclic nucleotide-binding domain-containing protein 2 n=1 Tax=Branchiostoma lanceolatum TaxID=7740 RepID=A0A8J9ZNR0_BRALA|nr:CNBD2 [Branchiostoma lanceolatum]
MAASSTGFTPRPGHGVRMARKLSLVPETTADVPNYKTKSNSSRRSSVSSFSSLPPQGAGADPFGVTAQLLESSRRRRKSSHNRKRSSRLGELQQWAFETKEERRLRLRRQLWRAMICVRVICRMQIVMRASWAGKDGATNILSELHYYAIEGDNGSLAFDKNKFSRKASSHVPEWARRITEKSHENRTNAEVHRLYSILKLIRAFEKYTFDVKMQLCRHIFYMNCEKGRLILRQGHIGEAFYFIFSGSVLVNKIEHDHRTGEQVSRTETVLYPGDSFGEIALLSDGRRRASIVAREGTELFQVDKDTFVDTCSGFVMHEMGEKRHVIRDFPLFKEWSDDLLERLCFESQLMDLTHGRVIDRDINRSDSLYFVIKGEVQMLREFTVRPREAPSAPDTDDAWNSPGLPARPRTAEIRARPGTAQVFVKQKPAERGDVLDGNTVCYAQVGVLEAGDHTEWTARTRRRKDKLTPPGAILVSLGARVLRMSKTQVYYMAPKGVLETFERTYRPKEPATEEELNRQFDADLRWADFKARVVQDVLDESRGQPVAMKPTIEKATQDYDYWPQGTLQLPRRPATCRGRSPISAVSAVNSVPRLMSRGSTQPSKIVSRNNRQLPTRQNDKSMKYRPTTAPPR